MDYSLKESIWKQFGASIDMLENAIIFCPTEHWDTDRKFWYNAFHCLFFLDYYLTMDPKTFSPPPPFSLSEFEDVCLKEYIVNRITFLPAIKSREMPYTTFWFNGEKAF